MTALLLYALSLAPADLPDAHRFGVCREVARANESTADTHLWAVVSNMPDDARFAWWARQDVVRRAWRQLATSLDGSRSMDDRMEALRGLRDSIGVTAWMDGRMPAAIPDYTAFAR